MHSTHLSFGGGPLRSNGNSRVVFRGVNQTLQRLCVLADPLDEEVDVWIRLVLHLEGTRARAYVSVREHVRGWESVCMRVLVYSFMCTCV